MSLFLIPSAYADDDKTVDENTLRETVLYGTRAEAIYATSQLLKNKKDQTLALILAKKDLPKKRRLSVLSALSIHGRERPVSACKLASPFLNSSDKALKQAALKIIVENEPLTPPRKSISIKDSSYQFLQEELLALVKGTKSDPKALKQLKTYLDILEVKQDPILATSVLIAVLKQSSPLYKNRVEQCLETVAGVDEVKDWDSWFQREKRRSRAAWLMRRIAQLKKNQEAEKAKLEKAAADVFQKLVLALAKNDQGLMTELEAAILESPVEAARLKAIRMLGEIGRKSETLGARAVAFLEKLFDNKDISRAARLATIRALGETKRKRAVEPLQKRLNGRSREEMLVALEAMAALKQPEVIPHLTSVLDKQLALKNPDVDLLFEVLQGFERLGLDPKSQISSKLIQITDRLRVTDPKKPWLTVAQRQKLLQASVAALGQLDYESEAVANKAVACLVRLIDYPEAAVRFFVADSLSRLTIVDARKHLETLSKDSELRVRSAAVRGLGRCGLRPNTPKDARRQIIASLIDLYLGPDKDLRPIAQTGLSNLNKDDFDKTLLNLTLTTEVFDKKNKIAAAMPFLEILELEDNIAKDRAPRYHWLLEARVRAALAEASNVSEKRKEAMIQSALADARYLDKSPYTKAKARYRRLEAEAHLLLGDGQTVCQLLAKDGKLEESWKLWKRGLKLLQEKKQKTVVQKLLNELNKKGFTPKQLTEVKSIERWLGGKAPIVKGPGKKAGGKP